MKAILVSIIAVMAMVLLGWLTFDASDDVVSVHLDTAEVKEDTSKTIEAGEELVDRISESTQDTVESAEQAVNEVADDPIEADSEETSAETAESTQQAETE